MGDLIDPDTSLHFNTISRFKQLKPLMRVFWNTPRPFGDRNGEGGNAHPARRALGKEILGAPEDNIFQAQIIRSFMLHNEGMNKE